MSAALETIRHLIAADIPVLLWGAPGIGKTSVLIALAREAGAHLEVVIGATVDPVDVGGYPTRLPSGEVVLSPPPWAVRVRTALSVGRPAWVFFDEMSCSPPAVQAAMLRVVQERHAGGVNLAGCRIVGAANPPDTAADGGFLSPAAASRWGHVDWTVDPAAWVVGELSGWGATRSPGHARGAAAVAGYIRVNPKALSETADGASAGLIRGAANPRAWSNAARALAAVDPRSSTAISLVASCVGPASAAQWSTWMVTADLPDPEDILSGRAPFPTRPDAVHAAAGAVVAAAAADHPEREQRMRRAAEILSTQRPDTVITAAQAHLAASQGVLDPALKRLADMVWRVK